MGSSDPLDAVAVVEAYCLDVERLLLRARSWKACGVSRDFRGREGEGVANRRDRAFIVLSYTIQCRYSNNVSKRREEEEKQNLRTTSKSSRNEIDRRLVIDFLSLTRKVSTAAEDPEAVRSAFTAGSKTSLD